MEKKIESETNLLRCVLEGYFECPANTVEACFCIKMPILLYTDLYLQKYGSKESNDDRQI